MAMRGVLKLWLLSIAFLAGTVISLPVQAVEQRQAEDRSKDLAAESQPASTEIESILNAPLHLAQAIDNKAVKGSGAFRDDHIEIGQVTSVSQLSDVQPTDWAFQALQSLVERYGCIAGYPDGTFRGNRAATRYELAAALNACLDSD